MKNTSPLLGSIRWLIIGCLSFALYLIACLVKENASALTSVFRF